MSEKMTDERLTMIGVWVAAKGKRRSWERELLEEVRRLRSEAIVWHPWPGEKPEFQKKYLVTSQAENKESRRVTDTSSFNLSRGYFTFDGEGWDDCMLNPIIAWAEMPAPYGGV